MKKILASLLGAVMVLGGTQVAVQPAQAATHKVFVGVTMNDDSLAANEDAKFADNAITRLFPGSQGTLPPTTDPVIQYAIADGHTRIAVSTKCQKKYVDGGVGSWSACMTNTKNRLIEYAAIFNTVYYTEHHEPEGDMSASAYKTLYTKSGGVFDTINSLTPADRAKVKVGHALTRQYTDNTAGGDWKPYDTGLGDFFAGDMYNNSWGSPGSTVATSYQTPTTIVSSFGGYRYDGLSAALTTDHRDRMFFELGAVGLPFDTTGSARNTWIQGIHQQVNTWDTASKGWNFIGWIWWGIEGTGGSALTGSPGIGTKRWFQLDVRHTGGDLIPGGTNDKNAFQTFAPGTGSAIDRWNQIATYNNN